MLLDFSESQLLLIKENYYIASLFIFFTCLYISQQKNLVKDKMFFEFKKLRKLLKKDFPFILIFVMAYFLAIFLFLY